MAEERKIHSLGRLADAMVNNFMDVPLAKISLHNEKSYNSNTVFSTIVLPLTKAKKIFGDCEILYPQIIVDESNNIPYIKFGIVVDD